MLPRHSENAKSAGTSRGTQKRPPGFFGKGSLLLSSLKKEDRPLDFFSKTGSLYRPVTGMYRLPVFLIHMVLCIRVGSATAYRRGPLPLFCGPSLRYRQAPLPKRSLPAFSGETDPLGPYASAVLPDAGMLISWAAYP